MFAVGSRASYTGGSVANKSQSEDNKDRTLNLKRILFFVFSLSLFLKYALFDSMLPF